MSPAAAPHSSDTPGGKTTGAGNRLARSGHDTAAGAENAGGFSR
jgi:hypothetical protein